MRALMSIAGGIVAVIILAPFVIKLARRWSRGTAAFITGNAVGGAVGESGMGAYITELRTGDTSGNADSSSDADFVSDFTPFDSDSSGGGSDSH